MDFSSWIVGIGEEIADGRDSAGLVLVQLGPTTSYLGSDDGFDKR